ncbi:ornithine decarboxylase antizyme 3 [Spea bombifrons]|uniref:ornithine decarboxylase antizyme 3 n=1 Tax=Spea bombifrons TaxID=233779 RepID=UPI00234A53EC|nr:ornithine decarboxylase antizyme 3 [Spea bombifrons]XP_053330689.1 ornithine decarboxylase antizyme 3 [Spea bombifrons]
MDFPSRMLDQGSRDSLTATLEYAELTMKVNTVFVSVHKEHKDRGQLLRAFSFLGFEVVTPRNKSLPSCEEQIFMGYTLEKSP